MDKQQPIAAGARAVSWKSESELPALPYGLVWGNPAPYHQFNKGKTRNGIIWTARERLPKGETCRIAT